MRGYKKNLQTKVIRTEHQVTFGDGTQAIDLQHMLSHVPDSAKVIDIHDEGSDTSIVFQVEEADT